MQELRYFYCSGLQDWETRCTACIARWRTDTYKGRMRLVLSCPPGIVPAQFTALSTGSVGDATCIRTEEELRNKLRRRSQNAVISAGRPAGCTEMRFRFYQDRSFVVVLCVAPFFLSPDANISGIPKNLGLLKPGMSVECVISIANASDGLLGLRHTEILPAMDSYPVLMKEMNNYTKTIVMSERSPERQKRVLSSLLVGRSWEYSAQFLKAGMRQIWLAEQSLKKRRGIPDNTSLREVLLLSSNNFHSDGNALETTSAMTSHENGNTNRYSMVVNARTQVLSLHKYKQMGNRNQLPGWRVSS